MKCLIYIINADEDTEDADEDTEKRDKFELLLLKYVRVETHSGQFRPPRICNTRSYESFPGITAIETDFMSASERNQIF